LPRSRAVHTPGNCKKHNRPVDDIDIYVSVVITKRLMKLKQGDNGTDRIRQEEQSRLK